MRFPGLMLLAVALAPGLGCGTTVDASSSSQAQVFSPGDLDGLWRGIAVPLSPGDLALELTLGFVANGPGPNQVQLVHYSFPAPRSTDTVDYLALLSTYEIFYSPSGRLTLETRYLGFGPLGRFIDEQITKVLFMDGDRRTMVGTESIRVFEAGRLTIAVDSVLRLDRFE